MRILSPESSHESYVGETPYIFLYLIRISIRITRSNEDLTGYLRIDK
jgi:hypothetical protein